MIAVCSKHVKSGITRLDVPHVYKMNGDNKTECKCKFCPLHAEYKISNSLPYTMAK